MIARPLALALGLVLAAAPAARAEGPAPTSRPRVGKVGLRVMQIFTDTHQALVFDKDSGRHVVLGEGERVGKYEVVEIEDDQVVVQIGTREVVLMVDGAPAAAQVLPPVETAPRPPASELLDPYAPAPSVVIESGGLLDPYAPMMSPPPVSMGATIGMIDTRTPVREVLAPPEQRANTGTVDPYAPTPTTPAPIVTAPAPAPSVTAPAPAPSVTAPTPAPIIPAPPPAPPPPPAPAIEVIRVDAMNLQRADLQGALADFDKLAKELGFARTGTGVRLARVPAASYFYRLGFRAGDLVTAIDGTPIRTLDDAAGVYVRLGSAKKLAVEIDRGTAHGTLKFALK